ncbi:hypothetical protein D3C80_1921270 [compost metagenome]
MVKGLHLLVAVTQLRFQLCAKAGKRRLLGLSSQRKCPLCLMIVFHRRGHAVFGDAGLQQFVDGLP